MKIKLGREYSSTGKVIALTTYKFFLLVALLFSISGCIGKNIINVTLKNPKKANTESLNITVSNVQVTNHQIVITGTNLSAVSNFQIKEGSNNATLQIESQTSTSIVANTLSNVSFSAGKVFDFIFSSAQAATTFTVNFSLCDSTLGGKGFNCSITPNDKEVLSYDAVSGKWKPKAVNGLSYQGSWDATTAQPITSTAGDYFIVSVANAPYLVGDWIVFNGTTFDRIDNSQMITNVFGRTGAVTALEGDYNLNKLSDVTITAPATNQVLTYNGAAQVNGAATYTETDPGVFAFAKAALPTCGAGQALKGDGTSLSCVASGSTFSGTANRAIVTDGAGALAVSTITDTVLGYLSGATSNIQTQLDAKANSASLVDWSIAGVQTLEPSRLNLTTANRAVITSGTGVPTASAVTVTELGYLTGVTSAIQTQLDAKQGTLGTGTVTSTHIVDGTILDADLAGSIAQAKVTNLTTDLGNKQDTSTLAADVRGIALTGLSLVTNAAIQATDSILVALGLLQKQITDLDSTKLNKTGGTLTVGTIDGVPNPTTANQVANKAYVDSATSGLDPQTPSAYSPSCPTGYVSVPAIAYYPGPSFCVMKWEAKTGSNVVAATTAAAGTPVVSINRDNARASCRLIGAGYDLISNAQWQTIARNIADQATNWSTGTAYSGELNRGHSDASPFNSLAASTDNNGCNGTGQTCSDVLWDSQRRTHTLSNGEVIWDIAGNVWEWVSDNYTAIAGADGYISTMSSGDKRQVRYGNDQFCATPSSAPYCGMGNGYFNYSAGAVSRGGVWNFVVNVGVFTANLSDPPMGTYTNIGFRCVFVP